jgi:hypothetical protein
LVAGLCCGVVGFVNSVAADCRGIAPERGSVTNGSGGRRHAGDGCSTLLSDGLEEADESAERPRLEDLGICSTENLSSDGRASPRRHPPPRNHRQPSRTPSNPSPLSELCKVAAQCRGSRVGCFPWKCGYDRVCEPYGRSFVGEDTRQQILDACERVVSVCFLRLACADACVGASAGVAGPFLAGEGAPCDGACVCRPCCCRRRPAKGGPVGEDYE